ncbi:MAG: OmpH family outer membrane protein [Nitrospira sp.]|nr:MAG: OmpH family outer membrane protein [Nitrospira sp.]
MTGALALGLPLLLGACAGAPPAQSQTSAMSAQAGGGKIGVVDPQKLLNDTEPGKKARESLNEFMKNRQAVVELEEKDLKRTEDDLIKQGSVLSATAKKEREEAFRRRMMEYQQKVTDMNREVQAKQQEVLEGFRDKVERVVSKIAQQVGLQVVLERGRGGALVYHDQALDITARVVDEMNRVGPDAAPPKK